MQCTVGEIQANAAKMRENLPVVVELVHDEYDEGEQDAALIEVEQDLESLVALFEGGADYYRDRQKELASSRMSTGASIAMLGGTSAFTGLLTTLSGLADSSAADAEHAATRVHNAKMLVAFGEAVEGEYGDVLGSREVPRQAMLRAYHAAYEIGASIGNNSKFEQVCTERIRRWEPGFKTRGEVAAEEQAAKAAAEEKAWAAKKEKREESFKRHGAKIVIAVVVVLVAIVTFVAVTRTEDRDRVLDNARTRTAENDFYNAYYDVKQLGDDNLLSAFAREQVEILCQNGLYQSAITLMQWEETSFDTKEIEHVEMVSIDAAKEGERVFLGRNALGFVIEWKVMEASDEQVVVYSPEPVCNSVMNQGSEEVDWPSAHLHEYFNGAFVEETFTDAERERIVDSVHIYAGELDDSWRAYVSGTEKRCTDMVFVPNIVQALQFGNVRLNYDQNAWPSDRGEGNKFMLLTYNGDATTGGPDRENAVLAMMVLRRSDAA